MSCKGEGTHKFMKKYPWWKNSWMAFSYASAEPFSKEVSEDSGVEKAACVLLQRKVDEEPILSTMKIFLQGSWSVSDFVDLYFFGKIWEDGDYNKEVLVSLPMRDSESLFRYLDQHCTRPIEDEAQKDGSESAQGLDAGDAGAGFVDDEAEEVGSDEDDDSSEGAPNNDAIDQSPPTSQAVAGTSLQASRTSLQASRTLGRASGSPRRASGSRRSKKGGGLNQEKTTESVALKKFWTCSKNILKAAAGDTGTQLPDVEWEDRMLEIGSAALYFSQVCAYQVGLYRANCQDATKFPSERYFGRKGHLWADGKAKSSIDDTADNYASMINKYLAHRKQFQTKEYKAYMKALAVAEKQNSARPTTKPIYQVESNLAAKVLKDPLNEAYSMKRQSSAASASQDGDGESSEGEGEGQGGVKAYTLHEILDMNGLQDIADDSPENSDGHSDDEQEGQEEIVPL